MADAITIKALQDASLDAKSLEEVVNGNDAKQVTTRLGESYPSVKKAIKTLFENGGLPATPFKTKAAMEASGILDNSYAMVTDDGANSGFYIKEGGVWSISSYNPLSLARGELKEQLSSTQMQHYAAEGSYLTKVELTEGEKGTYDYKGGFISNPLYSTSIGIPVKKGECYLLRNLPLIATERPFLLYDETGEELKGVLLTGRMTPENLEDRTLAKYYVGRFTSLESLYNQAVRIPHDGIMKVTIPLHTNRSPYDYLKEGPKLYKVDFKTFCDSIPKAVHVETLYELEDSLYSVLSDLPSAILNRQGFASLSEQVKGLPLRYTTVTNGVLTNKVPVKKGQYLQVQLAAAIMYQPSIYIVDADNKFLEQAEILTESSVCSNGRTPYAFINIPVNHDGFAMLEVTTDVVVAPFISVTDNLVRQHIDYLQDYQRVQFHPSKGPINIENYNTIYREYSLDYFMNSTNAVSSWYTCSQPYTLKKGDVLEYTLDASSIPVSFVAFEHGKVVTDGVIQYQSGVTIVDNTAIEDTAFKAWLASNKAPTDAYFGSAKQTVSAFCNEDSDTTIIFLSPTSYSDKYTSYGQQESYSLRVYSIENYKKKRDAELTERFKTVTRMFSHYTSNHLAVADTTNNGQCTFPAVLLFKGEVLNYATTGIYTGTALDLVSARKALPGYSILSPLYNIRDYRFKQIDKDNPDTWSWAQVYAKRTCVVYPGIQYYAANGVTNLDTDGFLLSNEVEPKIVTLADSEVGKDLRPIHLVAYGWYYNVETINTPNPLLSRFKTSANDVYISFAPGNTAIQADFWSAHSAYSFYYKNLSTYAEEAADSNAGFKSPCNIDDDGQIEYVTTQACNNSYIHLLEEPALVAATSNTINRTSLDWVNSNEGATSVINELNPLMVGTYNHGLNTVPTRNHAEGFVVTDKTFLNIPLDNSIVFNFPTSTGNSLESNKWCIVQIKSGDRVLAVLNAKTENQGQSTAALSRKNVNIEFYNNEYEDVYIKFGNYPAEAEIVLKSFLNTDKSHVKETTAISLWYDIRNARPYPNGGVIPKEVFDNIDDPRNQAARGTTFGFPVVLERGSKFASLATVRSKKKRENYAMEKSNKKHVLLQADWTIKGALNWDTVDMGNFEIRNPKISGYELGATQLPAGNEEVQGSVERILSWMQGVHKGTISVTGTYQDYIDLDSFIDYTIASECVHNWDGLKNNFLLGTHDGKIWGVYMYDLDQSWGSSGFTKLNPYSIAVGSGTLFSRIATRFKDKIAARYTYLRDQRVIDPVIQQHKFKEVYDQVNSYARIQDAKYWGGIHEIAGLPFLYTQTLERINMLDAHYGYKDVYDRQCIYTSTFSLTELSADSTEEYSISVPEVDVGSDVYAVYGGLDNSSKLTAEVREEGVVTLVHHNLGSTSVTSAPSYIKIYRGEK